jgi:histone-lysine N-methyltransferase SETD2
VRSGQRGSATSTPRASALDEGGVETYSAAKSEKWLKIPQEKKEKLYEGTVSLIHLVG